MTLLLPNDELSDGTRSENTQSITEITYRVFENFPYSPQFIDLMIDQTNSLVLASLVPSIAINQILQTAHPGSHRRR
jgi:hypothetical protein